jgi:hypothetical protein
MNRWLTVSLRRFLDLSRLHSRFIRRKTRGAVRYSWTILPSQRSTQSSHKLLRPRMEEGCISWRQNCYVDDRHGNISSVSRVPEV